MSDVNKKKNRDRAIWGVMGFITVIAAAIIVRIVYGWNMAFEINAAYYIPPMDRYYDPAFIGDNGLVYSDYFSLKGLYLTLLSCVFKFSGNILEAITLFNIFVEVIAVILIYFAVKRLFGRVCAFIISLICAFCPYWGELPYFWGGTQYVILWRENRLIFLGIAIGLYLLSLLIKGIVNALTDDDDETEEDEDDIAESAEKGEDKSLKESVSGSSEDTADNVADAAADNAQNAGEGPGEGGDASAEGTPEGTAAEEEYDIEKDEDIEIIEPWKPEPNPDHEPLENYAPDESLLVVVEGNEVEVQLLQNPLPLPKQPDHKDMDYDYQISDDKLDFDV